MKEFSDCVCCSSSQDWLKSIAQLVLHWSSRVCWFLEHHARQQDKVYVDSPSSIDTLPPRHHSFSKNERRKFLPHRAIPHQRFHSQLALHVHLFPLLYLDNAGNGRLHTHRKVCGLLGHTTEYAPFRSEQMYLALALLLSRPDISASEPRANCAKSQHVLLIILNSM